MGLSKWISKASEWLAKGSMYLILALVAVVCFDVLMRYAFGRPTAWSYEVAVHFYSIAFLISGAWVLSMDAHVKVDVIYVRFSERTRATINLVFYLFFLFPLCYFVVKDGLDCSYVAWKVGEVSRSSPIHEPIWPLKFFIPISFFMLALQGLVKLWKDLGVLLRWTPRG
jgi:TRAP-type mannitol/chloroaromatic compound transport system permease small subunit